MKRTQNDQMAGMNEPVAGDGERKGEGGEGGIRVAGPRPTAAA